MDIDRFRIFKRTGRKVKLVATQEINIYLGIPFFRQVGGKQLCHKPKEAFRGGNRLKIGVAALKIGNPCSISGKAFVFASHLVAYKSKAPFRTEMVWREQCLCVVERETRSG